MDSSRHQAAENRLLTMLPAEEYRRLASGLTRVEMARGQVLMELREHMEHAYFPLDGVLSLMMVMEGGTAVEVATVGREGFVSPASLLSIDLSPYEVLCQTDCTLLRLSVEELRAAFRDSAPLRDLLLRYAGVLLSCTGRSAACRVVHTTEQRLARWLLMTRDRMATDELPLTHELLARMLGVRRATVSVSAAALQGRGLIRYRRGQITITDRAGLETAACEDYATFQDEYERLLGPTPDNDPRSAVSSK
jgi:CRP-like cAMP-binding protein